MIPVCILFFLSGFAALVYELLWMRHFRLVFGNTVHAASTVMAAYMLGLALGARFGGKWAARVKRPVRLFGALEGIIGVYALCVPALFALVRIGYRFAYQQVSSELAFLTLTRFVLGLLILLVPTSLMGATLPILSQGLAQRRRTFGARLGVLYGVNTLGAVAGVLLCGFVLLPGLGLNMSNVVAVATNVIVCLLAWAVSAAMKGERETRPLVEPEASRRTPGKPVVYLLLAAGVSGFLALCFEVVWFRALILVFGSTTYSFSAMLAVFLLGIALGAALLSWLSDRMPSPMFLFAAAQTVIGAYTIFSMRMFGTMPDFLLRFLVERGFTWPGMLAAKFVIALMFLLVPTLCFGVSFTAVARAVRSALPSSPRVVGRVYTFNTVGAALGACVGGFVLLPLLGMEGALMLLTCLALATGLAAAVSSRDVVWRQGLIVLVCIVCSATIALRPPRWNRQLLAAGPYFSPWNFVKNGKITLHQQLQSERLLFFREGVTATVSVIRSADERLYFCMDGKVEADTTARSMVLQRMMGHLPMLFHPDPGKVLNIGFGAGVTLGALGCYPTTLLEVVEIEPVVKRVGEIWGPLNHNIADRPDVVMTINDGRNHLFANPQTYDVITSDPFEPVMAGAASLYTVEHFRQARQRLTPGGIMAQYLPLYELSRQDFLTIVRSFVRVFPNSHLFFTGFDTILLGYNGESRIDVASFRRKFDIPIVRQSLSDIGFDSPELILGMFVADLSRHKELAGPGPLNTDVHPLIEFSAPMSSLHYTPDKNQQVLLAHFSEVPEKLTAMLSETRKRTIQKKHEALRKALKANMLRGRNDMRGNVKLLMEAAEQDPDNPVIRNELVASLVASAQSMLDAGERSQAFAQYQLALRYNPDEFWALYHLVNLAMRSRQIGAAKRWLDRGLRLYPQSPLFVALRGKYRGTIGDAKGACADLEWAIDKLPGRADFREDFAVFLEASGHKAAAARERAAAARLRLLH